VIVQPDLQTILDEIAFVQREGSAFLRDFCASSNAIASTADMLGLRELAEMTRILVASHAEIQIEVVGIGMLMVVCQTHLEDLRSICRANPEIASALADHIDVPSIDDDAAVN
jgi:hypothetical protein